MSQLVALEYKHSKPNFMTVDWYIGKRCNWDCSYCSDFIHDTFSAHIPFNQMKIFVDRIIARYGVGIQWSMVGGEPTINPDFLTLLQYMQDKKDHISVCTNGSRSLKYLTDMFALVDNITLSLHFEYVASKLDEYTDKLIALEKWKDEWNALPNVGYGEGQPRPKTFIARVMVLPGFSTEIIELTEKLKAAGIKKLEHRVIRPQGGKAASAPDVTKGTVIPIKAAPKQDITIETLVAPSDDNLPTPERIIEREKRWYDDKDRETLTKLYAEVSDDRKNLIGYVETDGEITRKELHYNSLNFEYKTNFAGWTCNAGLTLLKIAPNGNIYIGNCFQGGPIANIYTIDENTPFPTGPTICTRFRCTDPLDLRQAKYADPKYAYLIGTK